MVCMTNPKDGLKGDTKLVKKRREVLGKMGCVVDVLYFEWDWFRSSVRIESSMKGVGVDIVAKIGAWNILGWLIRANEVIRDEPVQTWVSFGIGWLHRKQLRYIFGSYVCIHFVHIRSVGLWRFAPSSSRIIVDLIDSYTLNIGNRLKKEGSWWKRVLLRAEYARMERMEAGIERYIVNEKKTTLVTVAKADIDHFGLGCTSRVVVPVGIEREVLKEKNGRNGKIRCIFFGNLDYEPNVRACHVIERASRIMRKRRIDEDIEITVAGRNISYGLKKRLSRENIRVESPVGDMHELVKGHDLAIMPMVSGSGMQSKVLEAIAWGVVVLTTSRAAKPVGLVENREYIEIDSAESLVERIVAIKSGEYDIERIRREAHHRIEQFEWEKTCKVLLGLYEAR